MARIHIDLPENILFSTDIEVRVTDLNYGGHVGNDQILSLIHEARMRYYRQLGFKSEIVFEGTVGQIIADAALVYKSESFMGDIITINIMADEFTKYGFDMYYHLINKQTNKEVARAKTGIVCFDYDKRKVAAVPSVLLEKLKP